MEKLKTSGLFKTKDYNPKDNIFQHMAVEVQIFNDRKNRYEEINRFRNEYIRQHFTSVDIEEVIKVGGVTLEFFDGFNCDNLDFNTFEKLFSDITQKKQIWKRKETFITITSKKKVQTLYMVLL